MPSPETCPRLLIVLKAARGHQVVDVRKILFAKAEDRFCRMHFIDGTEKPVFHTLAELEAILNCGVRMGDLLFARLHKSHIVSSHFLASIEPNKTVVLCTGHQLPIGRQYWSDFLKNSNSVHGVNNGVHAGIMSFARNADNT